MELVTHPYPIATDTHFVAGIYLCDGWADHALVRIHPFDNGIRPYIQPPIRRPYTI
jgi:hypothetical protein